MQLPLISLVCIYLVSVGTKSKLSVKIKFGVELNQVPMVPKVFIDGVL